MRLREGIEEYIADYRYRRMPSYNVSRIEERMANKFVDFIEKVLGDNPFIDDISVKHIRAYGVYLFDQDLKLNSISTYIGCVRRLFRFFESNEIVEDASKILRMPIPKTTTDLPEVLTEEEVTRLLDTPVPYDNEFLRLRDQAILELLYATGMRAGEIVKIRVSDIDFEEKKIRVRGKGKKERIVPFNEKSRRSLVLYLDFIQEIFPKKVEGPVFITFKGGTASDDGMTEALVNLVVTKRARAVGLKRRVYPHLLRHTFATHLINGGAGIRSIQKMLGHASIMTTQRYTHVAMPRVFEEYNKCHPRSSE